MTFLKMESAGYLANHMARLFAQGLQRRIEPMGIVIGQFPVLLELWEADGLTQRQLVERLDVEQATIANTLIRMERDGLIHRTPHPTDRRAQQVWLTPQADALRDPAIQAAQDQNAAALANLSDDEKTVFVALMRRVMETMRADRGD